VQIERVVPYHKVKEGDTVGSIAQKYKMKRAELIKLNNLHPPYQLYNGQKLVVNLKVENVDQDESDITVTDASNQMPADGKPLNVTKDEIAEESVKTIDDIKETPKVVPVKKEPEYIWPIENGNQKISKKFGEDGVEGGITIDASAGTPVKAIADGIVIISGVPSGEAAAYGITVAIKHPNKKKMSIYSYLKEATVEIHKTVRKGDIIGKVGKSGTRAEKPQLYFEISDFSGKGRRSIDPEKLLSE
jgi:murein DD-endopeptidase MepM/ murein hydrolase activator NlpD